jgi:hypothetical protein
MYRFAMERAEILSEILRDQIRSGAPRESLLWTLGMIRTEILAMPAAAGSSAEIPGKPAGGAGTGPSPGLSGTDGPRITPNPSDAGVTTPPEPFRDPSSQPATQADPTLPPPETAAVRRIHPAPAVEVNQRVADGGASLNDRLRQDATDLAGRLMPEAVADLRSAFGINDRFRLISELFGGDGAAFDEAVQRLNGMPGISEALTHIDRGLCVRWGWDVADPMVEQLRQSVRRRFSAI